MNAPQPTEKKEGGAAGGGGGHAISEADIEEEQEKIASYEAAFREIKEATGVADVNEARHAAGALPTTGPPDRPPPPRSDRRSCPDPRLLFR